MVLRGRVDTATAGVLKDRLSQLIESGLAQLVIDFRDVAYISSAGFRTLLIIAKQSGAADGRLAWWRPPASSTRRTRSRRCT